MVLEIELLDCAITKLTTPIRRDTLDSGKVFDVFLDGHVFENWVRLWAIADKLLDLVEIFGNV